jgi:predicted PurR-regulated permease PerM
MMNSSLDRLDWPKRLVFWAALTAILFIFIWFAFELVLLAFAGVLLAILLHACADWVDRHTPKAFGPRLSYTTTVIGILILAGLIGYFVVPRAIAETGRISKIIPQSMGQITAYLQRSEWGRYVLRLAHESMRIGPGMGMSTITGEVAGAIEGAVVILVVGFYGAVNAREDARGLLRLVPANRRERVKEVSGQVIFTLRWWIIGQLIPMTVLGVSTMLGLWVLNVPLAFALGLLTGLMIFIPYVGSWIAFVPTVLVALTVSPMTALYVVILYVILHAIEGYVLTPLVQKHAVLLPPVMTILAQLLLWRWVGLLGVAVATPLAAAGLALIKVLYLHDDVEK